MNDIVHKGSANEDLIMTFGVEDHVVGDITEPLQEESQEADFDEALVAHIASDLASEYRVCSISAFHPYVERNVNVLALHSDHSINVCHMCGSYEHTTTRCPDFLRPMTE